MGVHSGDLAFETFDLADLARLLKRKPTKAGLRRLRADLTHLYQGGFPYPLPMRGLLWSRVKVMQWLHGWNAAAPAAANVPPAAAGESPAVLSDRSRLEMLFGVGQ